MSTTPVVVDAPLYPMLDVSKLQGFAPELITDGAGLDKVTKFLARIASEPLPAWDKSPALGLDTETNITPDFFNRKARTIQIGNHEQQFCIDLLAFSGDPMKLVEAQGYHGRNSSVLSAVIKVLQPALTTSRYLKVGLNLPFEYEVLSWGLGMRIWHLYSADLVERVIQAGAHSLKDYPFFSLRSITERYFKKTISKDLRASFDLCTPLTQGQVEYATLDTYLPLAIRQQQLKIITRDELVSTSQIENDALGSYTDMGIWGQRIDSARWMERINKRKAELVEALATLDTHFIPIVGSKSEAIDEKRLTILEAKWRGFDIASQEELEACSAYKAVSSKKDPILRAELKAKYEVLEKNRRDLKAAARVTYSELSKKRTKAKEKIGKCQGEAFINYNSGKQLLAAFATMYGYKTVKKTDKDTLLGFNDDKHPVIKPLLSLNKLKKEIGTYGEQWTKQWVNKPCKEEGWLHPGDGRLHCKYNQLEAETGRSSSSKPNAQNLPKDEDVRACFICDPPDGSIRISVCCDSEVDISEVRTGIDFTLRAEYYACRACGKPCDTKAEEYCIVTCDMSGAELRIIAELANAGSWITAFAKGHDVHSVGTEILFPVEWPAEQVKSLLKPDGWSPEDSNQKTGEKVPLFNDDGTPLVKKNKEGVLKHVHVPPCAYFAIKADGELSRQKCECPKHKKRRDGNKATNFLLAYGGGPSALADAIGCTTDEAKALMKLHEAKFPDIWGYLKKSGEQARFKKEARDMYGRRRLFPDPTWAGAKEFFIQEHPESLELDEEDAEAQVLAFKMKQLRLPTEEEEYLLTHREPSTKEIASAYRGMYGSIERRGKNMCIQGTNASIIKRAMGCGFDKNGVGYLWHLLPEWKAKILSMVHDELVVQCPRRFSKQVFKIVGDAFTRAGAEVMKKVIMEYDGNIGPCWSK